MPARAQRGPWAALPPYQPQQESRAAPPSCANRCSRHLREWKAERLAACVIGLRHAARQKTHPPEGALPLGDRDRVAGIQKVEGVRGLEELLVCRQRKPRRQEIGAGFFVV